MSTLIMARDLRPGDVIRPNVAPHVPAFGSILSVTRVAHAGGRIPTVEVYVTGASWTVEYVGPRYAYVLVSRANGGQ
jgi:hypothetical protein